MRIEWSGLSPELLLVLDREATQPLRSQLEDQLRDAVRSGRLSLGERLPSSRELARALGLSRGLVQDCYAQLQAEGYLMTRLGSATRVAAGSVPSPAHPVPPAVPRRMTVDFRHGVPDLASFPRADWLWALREACNAAPKTAFDYGDPRGSPELREIVAAYLRRVRAADADPERLVICTGFAQGLVLALRALATRGGTGPVAFEDPGQRATTAAAAAFTGLETVPVPVDDLGIDVARLDATGARAVVVTPAHQWPSGVVLAPERRLELVAWAVRRDATIIEDDYDAEFRYDREPVGCLQGLAADRVISIGTVSKSLAPSLRLGWMACPPGLIDSVALEKRRTDRGSPGLEQLALATLIESGRYDRHLRRMRLIYSRRREALVTALASHAPQVALTGLAAGFHAVAHLPEAADEHLVIAEARARSVGLYGMSPFRSSGATTPTQLILGFGDLSERAVSDGIAAVADLLG